MMNGQGNSGGNSNIVPVNVPKETHHVDKKDDVDKLEYVGRKPWKYQTVARFDVSIEKKYDIWVSPEVSEEMTNDYFIILHFNSQNKRVNQISIEAEYAWDGASGPTVDTYGSFKAALVHDAFYQCMRLGYVTPGSRNGVDKLFRDMLEAGGVPPLRRQIWYLGVHLFGKKSTTPKPHKEHKIFGLVFLILGLLGFLGIAGLVCWMCSRWQEGWLGLVGAGVSGVVGTGVSGVVGWLGYELWKGDDG